MVTFQCYMEFAFDGCCHSKIICFYEWILKVESNVVCRGKSSLQGDTEMLLYSTLLYSTLLYSTLLYSTLLYNLFYSTLSMGHATVFFQWDMLLIPSQHWHQDKQLAHVICIVFWQYNAAASLSRHDTSHAPQPEASTPASGIPLNHSSSGTESPSATISSSGW